MDAQAAKKAPMSNQDFLAKIRDDIKYNRLALPTLPEVAMKVRKVVENPNASVSQMAKVLNADPALSARLLRVANSPLHRARSPIESVQTAVARLGVKLVRNLVSALVMEQLYNSGSNKRINEELSKLWTHSVSVAALSNVMARKFTSLSADEAMLAGLLHDIGKLPVLVSAEDQPGLLDDPKALDSLLSDIHCEVGQAILESWEFSPEITECVYEHEQLDRDKSPDIDLCDVVMLANLHSHIGTGHPHTKVNWNNIPAFKKLGLDPDESVRIMAEARDEVREIEKVLTS